MGFEPESGMTAADLFDWKKSVAAIEAMAPLWTPGTATLYHFVTFGLLVGEVIRRVDGRRIGQFVAEEIAGPLGGDLWIGLPEAETPGAARRTSSQDASVGQAYRAKLLAAAGCNLNDAADPRAFLVGCGDGRLGDRPSSTPTAPTAPPELPAGGAIADAPGRSPDLRRTDRRGGWRAADQQPRRCSRERRLETEGFGPPGGDWPSSAALGRSPTRSATNCRRYSSRCWELLGSAQPRRQLSRQLHGLRASGKRRSAVAYVCNAMLNSPTGPDPRWVGPGPRRCAKSLRRPGLAFRGLRVSVMRPVGYADGTLGWLKPSQPDNLA